MIERTSPLWIFILAVFNFFASPIGAQAEVWQTFKTRCLDAFEDFLPVMPADLKQIEDADLADEFSSKATAFGPTDEGVVVVIDPSPLLDGDRLCSVSGGFADRDAVAAWVATQVLTDRYEMSREGAATILLSHEWIEPRLQVTLVWEGLFAGTFSVLETYLES